jgi:endonuclease-3 related protein
VVEDITYEELRSFFMDVLPPDVQLYNEFHALIVRTAKKWCLKKKPLCSDCPLAHFLA